MCFLLIFLCIAGQSAYLDPLQITHRDTASSALLASKPLSQSAVSVRAQENTPKSKKRTPSLGTAVSIGSLPPLVEEEATAVGRHTARHRMSVLSMDHPFASTQSLAPQSKNSFSYMYTSRLSLANLHSSNLNAPQEYKSDFVNKANPKLVDKYPSEQEADWALSPKKERKKSIKKLRKHFFSPKDACDKMLDWLAGTVGPKTAYMADIKTFSNLDVGEGLTKQANWAVLLRIVLMLGLLNRQPSETPVPPHWEELDKLLSTPVGTLGQTLILITPNYASRINTILALIDQIVRKTPLQPVVMFEKSGTPTPRCQMLALADKKIIITLPGNATEYDGEYTIDSFLNDTTRDLASCLLSQAVNGRSIEEVVEEDFARANPVKMAICPCIGCSVRKSKPAYLSRAAHALLDWTTSKTYDLHDTSLHIKPQNIEPLKVALSCQSLLRPFTPLDHLYPFKASLCHQALIKDIYNLCPNGTRKVDIDDLMRLVPDTSNAAQYSTNYPCGWWPEGTKNVSKKILLQTLGSVYGFAVQKSSNFIDRAHSLELQTPKISDDMTITISSTDIPLLLPMALNPRHIWVIFPTPNAITSLNHPIDFTILINTLAYSIGHTLDMLTEGRTCIAPTLPFLKVLYGITMPARRVPPKSIQTMRTSFAASTRTISTRSRPPLTPNLFQPPAAHHSPATPIIRINPDGKGHKRRISFCLDTHEKNAPKDHQAPNESPKVTSLSTEV